MDKGASLRDRAGGLRPEPPAQSQPSALIPSAEITAILADYDEYIAPCPINNPQRGRVYAPHNKCENCGARSDQNCGLETTASWHLIKALRRIAGVA